MINKGINAFIQHGFIQIDEADNQIYGNCIFCKDEKHFFINTDSHKWDCKKCGKQGGFLTFLKDVIETSNNTLNLLSKNRSIKVKTLDLFNIKINENNQYLIPIYSRENKIINIKIFDIERKIFINTSTCKLEIFNLQHYNNDYEVIYLCEGEWDTIVIQEMINELKLKISCLGLPGANSWKNEWLEFFRNKSVYLLLDNDEAGEKGRDKILNILFPVCKEIKFIIWNKKPVGYDIRDLYKDSQLNCKSLHLNIKIRCKYFVLNGSKESKIIYGKKINYTKIYEVYNNWLHLKNNDILDILFSVVLANRQQGDPVWLFLVAPPGFTKSELLMSFLNCNKIIAITSLTSASLVSGVGQGSNDNSLIPRLNGNILVCKDLTAILNMNPVTRDEIFGIFRDAYDGRLDKHFATMERHYISKFGFIAGVTPIIEQYTNTFTAMGERFLTWKEFLPDDTTALLRRAILNVNNEIKMRNELNIVSQEFLLQKFDTLPELNNKYIDKLIALAQLVANLRSSVIREKFSKEITNKPIQELGTRLVKQFTKTLIADAQFKNKKITDENDYVLVKKLALHTIPTCNENILKEMYFNNNKSIDVEYLNNMSHLPNITIQRWLENLTLMKVLTKYKINVLKYGWKLSDKIKKLLDFTEIYKND
jgi:5S rRNA maturation endonuclease (ribonuclease M5)